MSPTLEKRDRGILALVVILMIGVPVLISYAYANLNGWSTVTPVDYNPVLQQKAAYPEAGFNNGTTYSDVQTVVCTNSTGLKSIVSLTMDTINSPALFLLKDIFNTTFLAEVDVSKITVSWNYVGTGNLTKCYAINGDTDVQLWQTGVAGTPATNLANNASYTFTLEAFQTQQVKAMDELDRDGSRC